jgi:15-cis-phytoene synthase
MTKLLPSKFDMASWYSTGRALGRSEDSHNSLCYLSIPLCREPALSLGVAFQLTNILRDVGEDAVKRGRVYLPQEDLDRFGVTENQLFEQRVDENYVNMMKFQIARARMYYDRARRGVFMLAPESRLPVQTSLDAYGKILDKIEENGYDSLTRRAYVDKWEKLSIIPFSWYRTLDVSRYFPLPGDKPIPDILITA